MKKKIKLGTVISSVCFFAVFFAVAASAESARPLSVDRFTQVSPVRTNSSPDCPISLDGIEVIRQITSYVPFLRGVISQQEVDEFNQAAQTVVDRIEMVEASCFPESRRGSSNRGQKTTKKQNSRR